MSFDRGRSQDATKARTELRGEPSRAAAKLVRTHAIAAMAAARRLCDVPNLAEITLSGVDPATGETIDRNLDPRAKEMRTLALACIEEYERQHADEQHTDSYVTANVPVGGFKKGTTACGEHRAATLSETDAAPAGALQLN